MIPDKRDEPLLVNDIASLILNEPMLKASTALHPLGRIGEPDEVASAIRWFLSPEQGWVTGQVLPVDGRLSSLQIAHGLQTVIRIP